MFYFFTNHIVFGWKQLSGRLTLLCPSWTVPALWCGCALVVFFVLFCFHFLCWAIKRPWKWMNHILIESVEQVCTDLMSMAGMILAEVKGVWMTLTVNWKSHLRPVWYPVKSHYFQFLTFWSRTGQKKHTKHVYFGWVILRQPLKNGTRLCKILLAWNRDQGRHCMGWAEHLCRWQMASKHKCKMGLKKMVGLLSRCGVCDAKVKEVSSSSQFLFCTFNDTIEMGSVREIKQWLLGLSDCRLPRMTR